MTTDFKSFAPSKDKTVTVTRKLTLAERKAIISELRAEMHYTIDVIF